MAKTKMPTLAYYKVYLGTPAGTESVIVTLPWAKRDIEEAAFLAWERISRAWKMLYSDQFWVKDVVPLKYVAGELRETRRMRVQKGKFQSTRRANARRSRKDRV